MIVYSSILQITRNAGGIEHYAPCTLTIKFNSPSLVEDIEHLLATGMSLDEALRSLPIGKYIDITQE